jgi:hypothetical protein
MMVKKILSRLRLSLRGFSRSNPGNKTVILNLFQDLQHRFRIKSGMTTGVALAMTTLAIICGLLAFPNATVKAESANSDLSLSINSVIALSVYDSNSQPVSTTNLSIDPTPSGAQTSRQHTVVVSTNTPGYTLSVKAGDSPALDEWAHNAIINGDATSFPDGLICVVMVVEGVTSMQLPNAECGDFDNQTLCVITNDGTACRDADNNVICEVLAKPIYAGMYGDITLYVELHACVDDSYYQSGSNDLVYQNPTDLDPKPTIPTTTNPIASPDSLANNTWGFAVPKDQATYTTNVTGIGNVNSSSVGFASEITAATFDNTYTEDSPTGKYAAPPTHSKTIKQTNATALADATTLFYAAKVDLDQLAGDYKTTITYTALGEEIPLPPEEFKFTIDTRMTDTPFADGDTPETNPTHYAGTATSFIIPTNASNITGYNWIVNCGGGQPDQEVSGASNDDTGITCNYSTPSEYQITIKSNGSAYRGWMNKFGFGYSQSEGAILLIKSLDTPIPKHAYFYAMAYTFAGTKNAIGIPADLLSLDMSTCSFPLTFAQYAANSTTATIPAGLFAGRNSTTCISSFLVSQEFGGFSKMSFYGTFFSYAANNTANDGTPDTDINDVFAGVDFAGIATPDAAATLFKQTFHLMPSLTGSAQTFINNQLGGITPTSDANTFAGTSVSDLDQLNENWK